MEEPIFPDKARSPTDADLAKVLGRAKRHWDNLETHALDANPDAGPEWKYYMKKTGWTFLLRGKRRNVLYMRPTGKGRFTVTFVFGNRAVKAAEQSDLPADLIEAIRQSPKYPEGRAANTEVTRATDVKIADRSLHWNQLPGNPRPRVPPNQGVESPSLTLRALIGVVEADLGVAAVVGGHLGASVADGLLRAAVVAEVEWCVKTHPTLLEGT